MPVDQTPKLIAIIDDDEAMQDSLRDLMEAAGLVAHCFASAEEFLASDLRAQAACLILDIRMPNMSGRRGMQYSDHLHHGSWRCQD
jgi:FixJ family two-component response regulator